MDKSLQSIRICLGTLAAKSVSEQNVFFHPAMIKIIPSDIIGDVLIDLSDLFS
jgi:hypothetical protein